MLEGLASETISDSETPAPCPHKHKCSSVGLGRILSLTNMVKWSNT